MSYQATEAVLKHSEAEGSARLVMLALAYHANKDGANAHPGIMLLCQETKLCERAVKYALKSLLKSGELVTESVGGGKTPSSYRINLPIAKEQAGVQDLHPTGSQQGCKSRQKEGVQNLHQCKSEQAGVQMATGRGANGDIAYKEEQSWNHAEQVSSSPAPVENLSLVPGPLTPPNPVKVVNRSRHSYADIIAFVEQTKPNAYSPTGLAHKLQRTGEEDGKITAWLNKRQQQAAAQQQAEQAAVADADAAFRYLELQEQAERYVASLPPDEYAARAAPIADALKRELGPEKLIRWTDEAFADHVRAKLIRQYLEQHQTTKGEHHEISSTHTRTNAYATA